MFNLKELKSKGLTKSQAVNMFKKEFAEVEMTKEERQEAFIKYLEYLESLGIIKGHPGKTWKNPF